MRIYATIVTLVLIAVLTNPPAERHYAELRQFYPSVDESLLADAQETVWRLTPPSDQQRQLPSDSTADRRHELQLIYTSLGALSFVQWDERWPPCGNDQGPGKPISIGFLGYVLAVRPPKGLYEKLEEKSAEQGQAKGYSVTFNGKGQLVAPDETILDTNSFRVRKPLIDAPPPPKDALYELGPLE